MMPLQGNLDFFLIRASSVEEDMEKKEPSRTVGKNINWCSHYKKENTSVEIPQKTKHRTIIQSSDYT